MSSHTLCDLILDAHVVFAFQEYENNLSQLEQRFMVYKRKLILTEWVLLEAY
jgi:hypothetical protein